MSPTPVIEPATLPLDHVDDPRLALWLRVREFAVPPAMIDTATARRTVGDWAGACAAAHVDLDLDLRALARTHGRELAARVRADLRHLAPDLLRWHLPRVAPDGLLRPGLTMVLARYGTAGQPDGLDENDCAGAASVHLVVRTPPTWATAGQRISLALWDADRPEVGPNLHPHPRPNRRYRLDLHPHLWDARHAHQLRIRCGTGQFVASELPMRVPSSCAVDRWQAEAAILLRTDQCGSGLVAVRCGARKRIILEIGEHDLAQSGPPALRIAQQAVRGGISALPVLPDAATWVLPDLELIRRGAITPDRLHPLVASALGEACEPTETPGTSGERLVECRGQQHRIGVVDGVLTALDHDPTEIRREELLVALTGTPMPCLQAIDRTHRRPDWLDVVREHLDHGDIARALTVVEGVLGADAVLRDGPLRTELEAAVRQRITYGLFRAGLPAPGRADNPVRRLSRAQRRTHPRHAASR
ncbi:hypothetical protein ACFWU5_12775 [Nocardia sp. NPDC058640]|uniref:hypothetical protein n=1 Tax=Nocardia sp. NPDC058640 TaxID=3346571 RepID=UPI0036462B56